jgi:DNA-binding beta-propeller fold protein YncE
LHQASLPEHFLLDVPTATYRDVFISHASEDKDAVARPLVQQLRALMVSVWFDEYELMLGDSLRATIGDGLRHSRVGVVILSPSFFGKRWPQWELDGLNARQIAGEPNVILPVWHDVDLDDVRSYSAPLADVVAAKSSDGVEAIANRIVRVLNRLTAGDAPERALAAGQPSMGESEIRDSFGGGERPRTTMAGGESHDRPSDASPSTVEPRAASTHVENDSKRSLTTNQAADRTPSADGVAPMRDDDASSAAPSGAQEMRAGWRRRTLTVAAGMALTAVAVGLTLVLVGRPSSHGGGLGLALKPGAEGCVSWDGTSGTCATARGMNGPHAIAVSPDGKNAYVAAYNSSALVAFDRNSDSGSLTPPTGAGGCFARDGAAYSCTDLQPLGGAEAVAVSPDGRSVYVASARSSALVILDRDVDSGALTPRPGRTGCFARDAGACAPARAMTTANGVAVSPDNRNVYVAAYHSDAIAIFDRDPRSRALEQKAGRAGCAARDGGSCVEAKLLTGPEAVTVSPDGHNVYVATDPNNAVIVFDRDRNGALHLKRGHNACVSEDGTNGDCAIAPEVGVGDSPDSVAVSRDGRNVYVASDGDGGVAILDRDSHGALKAKTGVEGCISRSGNGGRCARAKALLNGRESVTVSPDGTSVYVASYERGGLTVFDRDDRGALRLRPGHEGCISENASGGRCATAPTLAGAAGVAASPDGRNVYVASYNKDAVTVLDRLEATR